MTTRPRKKASKTTRKAEESTTTATKEEIVKATEENLSGKAASAREAYEEFQRQAENYRKKQWSSGAVNVQTFPPQYPIHSQPYGSHHHHNAAPYKEMASSQATQEGSQELFNKIGGMVRLGIDFINAGLAGGLSLMNGLQGQQPCHPHPHHHDPYHFHPNDCGPHDSSCCDCHHDYHHQDCCCQPHVRGCC